jgi:hypothetical protein
MQRSIMWGQGTELVKCRTELAQVLLQNNAHSNLEEMK